jgi:glutamine synthetase
MDCNPYLGIAASLACGLIGMRDEVEPEPEFRGDAYSSGEDIPRTLGEALEIFEDSPVVHEVLGTEFSAVYRAVKAMEYNAFLQVISPWEREHLLLNV